MDIRDVRSRGTNPAEESRNARAVERTPAARTAGDRSDDRVTLSDRAHAFQETRRAALAVPEVRTERVEAVKARLGDGSLAVDTERIARALLQQGIVRF